MNNLPRANDDSAARLLLAEHAEERGDVRMARAWRWMAERAKWPEPLFGWWPSEFFMTDAHDCLPLKRSSQVFTSRNPHVCEQALADALERGDL